MAYLEELLPKFRKGAKIRRKDWDDGAYLLFDTKEEIIIDQEDRVCEFIPIDIICDEWELYKEPVDWDYIIKNKCLCWFWDDDDTDGVMAILVSVYKDSSYRYYCQDLAGCGSSRKHCRPVCKDEVTFYEDEEDD